VRRITPSPEFYDSAATLGEIRASKLAEGDKYMSIFMILAVILVVAWILGLGVFHVAGGLIHLLLIFAVISLVVHFVAGRRSAV
jgi:hypothetical protein